MPASLAEQQWRAPTVCAGWRVHEMAAHLLQPVPA
ncbi:MULTISPECIES: maleylpyruvate isomerase N-terminal domain-containing protein [unclassified Actinoplanes]